MKTIEITQKELDKKIGEARQEGYDMGFKHGKSEIFSYKKEQAIKGVTLLKDLLDFLDERYELKHEDY